MKKELKKAILRYIAVYLVLGPANILVVTFPIAYAIDWTLRKLRLNTKLNPLWVVMDDTRFDLSKPSGLSEDYRIYLNDYKFRWIGVLLWHIKRNSIWNLREMFRIPKFTGSMGNQKITVLEYYKDNLYNIKDDSGLKYLIQQDTMWAIGAGLKFVPKHPEDDPWQVNRGDVINPDTSILGEGYILYKDDASGWISFRYTSCAKVKPWWGFGKEYWLTKYFGTNSSRYTLKYKFQAVKPWSFEIDPNTTFYFIKEK